MFLFICLWFERLFHVVTKKYYCKINTFLTESKNFLEHILGIFNTLHI